VMLKAGFALAAYVACIVGANIATNSFGFVPVGFGLAATAGTYAAGLALLARDVVQDVAGRRAVVAAVAVGAALSAWLSTPALALASGAAFLVSELADMAIYTPLRKRGWVRAVLASNLVGSAVDSIVFLGLAGFPIWSSLPGQMVGKVIWASLIPVAAVVVVRRVVLRQPVHAEGA
jgi:uncharacterized PurR-regulated membrane protein YhhQ (DUF165 family)